MELMLYVEYVTFALCSLTLVECSRMSRTMLNGALSEQYRNDVNKIDRPNTTPTVRAICTFASTDLNQALVLLRYYKNSPPISKSWIRACSSLTNLEFIIHRLQHCGTAVAVLHHTHYSTVTAGPREQEISAVQSGPGILQSQLRSSHRTEQTSAYTYLLHCRILK